MKEFESFNTIPAQDKIEMNVKKKQGIEYVLQGTFKPKPGHFIWELNEVTGSIQMAKFKRTVAAFGGKVKAEELIKHPNCIYIPALNAQNAKVKYSKNSNQEHYYIKPSPMSLSDII